MPVEGIYVDSSLLLLYIVGRTGREYITKHRRLSDYTAGDYDALLNVLAHANAVYVTPNTLTEASNLLGQHGEPERSRFMAMLHHVTNESQEIYVASVDASNRQDFVRLGLTDSVLLEAVSAQTPLLTVDMELFATAVAKGDEAAVNFHALRSL